MCVARQSFLSHYKQHQNRQVYYPLKSSIAGVVVCPKEFCLCVENSNRSQMAEAFARILGAGKVEAYSAGSRPSGKVNPKTIESMRELGYDLSQHSSKSLSEIPDVEYDFVATMGCGDECPYIRAKQREDWNIPDPKNMSPDDFRQVCNLIESKVKAMLARL